VFAAGFREHRHFSLTVGRFLELNLYLHLNTPNKSRVQVLVGQELFIDPQEKLIQEIEDLLGQNSVVLTI
jgi:hypothetical protein